MIIKNKGYAPGLAFGQTWCQLSQSVMALGPSLARESLPRIPRQSPQTRAHRWSRSPLTSSLYACDDDDATIQYLGNSNS